MAKFVHPNWGTKKYYYLSNGWSGNATLTEYRNGVKATSLTLDSTSYKQFVEKLQQNGWKDANDS